MSDNLGFTRIPQGVETPEPAINAALDKIDGLFTESLSVDLSAGNGAVTVAQIAAASVLSLEGAAVARSVALPAAKRILFALNVGTADVTVTRGTASATIPAGKGATLRLTGAENGLAVIGGTGEGGGGPAPGTGLPAGGTDGQYLAKDGADDGAAEWRDLPASDGGGLPEAPVDGKSYARKDATWAEIPASAGGGGGGVMPIKPPAPSLFIRRGGYAFQNIVGNERLTSFVRTDNGQFQEQSGCFAGFDVPTATNWQLDAIIRAPELSPSGYITYGLCIRHSVSGKAWIWGYTTGQNAPGLVRYAMNSMVSFNSESAKLATRQLEFFTIRIARQGDLFQFYRSSDFGLTWIMVMQDAWNNWFTERPDQIGFCHLHYNSYPSNYMVVPYMNLAA